MPEANARFAGSIPELYDRHLGPVMFEPYAKDLARRIDAKQPGPVLEIACGTGILTSKLRARLARKVSLIATDLSESMLGFARAKKIANVEWRQADATELPFPDASFAVVACQFGVMFVPPEKKAQAFHEMRRVLKPGGLLAFNVWDSLDANPFARVAYETVLLFFPNDPPTFYQVPFGFHDADVLRGMLAGFSDISIERVQLPCVAPSAASFAVGLVRGNPIITSLQERGASIEAVQDVTTEGLWQNGGHTPYRSTMQAVVVTARA